MPPAKRKRTTTPVVDTTSAEGAEAEEGVDESGPDLPVMPVAPLTDQFPAVDGTVAGLHAEVAQRSADGSDGDTYFKVVSVAGSTIPDDHPMHRANAGGVLQEAIQRGLHPRGDVYLVDKVVHDDPLNASGTRRSQYTDLRYAVQVIPASIDTEPELATLPRDVAESQP